MRSEAETWAFLEARAAQMRLSPTSAEGRVREVLEPLGFQFQFVITVPRLKHSSRRDSYILDFYHPGAMLCVEIDGGYHTKVRGPDTRRDVRLAHHGIRTMRFRNQDAEDPLKRLTILSIVKSTVEQELQKKGL